MGERKEDDRAKCGSGEHGKDHHEPIIPGIGQLSPDEAMQTDIVSIKTSQAEFQKVEILGSRIPDLFFGNPDIFG